MPVEFKANFSPEQWPAQLRARAAKVLAREMELAARQIVARTQSGTDFEGKAFKEYSKGYKAYKEAAGRDTSRVDLTFTGSMLKGVHTKTENNGDAVEGVIYITADQAEKARKHMQGIGVKQRQFFKLSKEQIRSLVEALRKVKLFG